MKMTNDHHYHFFITFLKKCVVSIFWVLILFCVVFILGQFLVAEQLYIRQCQFVCLSVCLSVPNFRYEHKIRIPQTTSVPITWLVTPNPWDSHLPSPGRSPTIHRMVTWSPTIRWTVTHHHQDIHTPSLRWSQTLTGTFIHHNKDDLPPFFSH